MLFDGLLQLLNQKKAVSFMEHLKGDKGALSPSV